MNKLCTDRKGDDIVCTHTRLEYADATPGNAHAGEYHEI